MRRYSALLPIAAVAAAILPLPAQQSQAELEARRAFLKAREEMTTIPWTPPAEAAPKPKPKPQPQRDEPAPQRPVVKTVPKPADIPVTLPPTPAPALRVAKSGVGVPDNDEPPRSEPGLLSRLFGGSSYTYVTGSVKRAISNAPVRKGRWRYIVVHNSGTRQGNAAAFENYHRRVRGMSNGMAYHFVIGNGRASGNGKIEIGHRWHRQIQGGHVHSDFLNNISVGICLVGDFNNERPTSAQKESLSELVRVLRERVGRVDGKRAAVRPHRYVNPPRWPTDCPGDLFPYRWLDSLN